MKLNFDDYKLYGNNCPRFTGIKDHGPKLELLLDSDTKDVFKIYGEDVILHIHQDETIYITNSHYNFRTEEWEETIVKNLTNNKEVKNALNTWLKEHPLYQSCRFPYPLYVSVNNAGSKEVCNSFDSLINYLKNY